MNNNDLKEQLQNIILNVENNRMTQEDAFLQISELEKKYGFNEYIETTKIELKFTYYLE